MAGKEVHQHRREEIEERREEERKSERGDR
jgi:hypothetical protein